MFITILKALAFAGAAIVGGIMAYRAYDDYGSHNFVNSANTPSLGYAGNVPTYGTYDYQNPYQTNYQQPQYAYGNPNPQPVQTSSGVVFNKSFIDELAQLVAERLTEMRRQQEALLPPPPPVQNVIDVEPEQTTPVFTPLGETTNIQSDWDREGDRALMIVNNQENRRGVRAPFEFISSQMGTEVIGTSYRFIPERRRDQYYDSEIHDMFMRDMRSNQQYPLCDYNDAFGGYIPVDRLRTCQEPAVIDTRCQTTKPSLLEPMYIESQPTGKEPVRSFHFQTNW